MVESILVECQQDPDTAFKTRDLPDLAENGPTFNPVLLRYLRSSFSVNPYNYPMDLKLRIYSCASFFDPEFDSGLAGPLGAILSQVYQIYKCMTQIR